MFTWVKTNSSQFLIGKTYHLLDIKLNNVLCNYRRDDDINQIGSDIRFYEVLLADFGSCVWSSFDYAKQGEVIGPDFSKPRGDS